MYYTSLYEDYWGNVYKALYLALLSPQYTPWVIPTIQREPDHQTGQIGQPI